MNRNRLGPEIPNIQFMSYLYDNMGMRNEEGASVQTRKEGTEINKRIMRRTPKKILYVPKLSECPPLLGMNQMCVLVWLTRSILNTLIAVISAFLTP